MALSVSFSGPTHFIRSQPCSPWRTVGDLDGPELLEERARALIGVHAHHILVDVGHAPGARREKHARRVVPQADGHLTRHVGANVIVAVRLDGPEAVDVEERRPGHLLFMWIIRELVAVRVEELHGVREGHIADVDERATADDLRVFE